MRTTEIKLPYGLSGEAIIHISEAPRGLACACVCPHCREPLIARKGSVTAHHFAHHNGAQCAHALETALHLASKRLLAERRKIRLPEVRIAFNSHRDFLLVAPESTYTIDDVREEQRTENIVPDLLAVIRGKPLIIEIRVTHAVDAEKLQKIHHLGVSAIEVDFSSASRDFSPYALADALINQTANKKWIYNASTEALKRRLLQTGERKPVIRRGCALHVDYCPIPARVWCDKPYANFLDDCINCEFCFDVAQDNSSIICGGRNKITSIEQLQRFRQSTAKPATACANAPTP